MLSCVGLLHENACADDLRQTAGTKPTTEVPKIGVSEEVLLDVVQVIPCQRSRYTSYALAGVATYTIHSGSGRIPWIKVISVRLQVPRLPDMPIRRVSKEDRRTEGNRLGAPHRMETHEPKHCADRSNNVFIQPLANAVMTRSLAC